ncbi:MAG: hypothetical protein QUS14_10990 [Pyrinomonadaceae bacterium]|nr:hypothetical protein [Pyrinomonadaceae bacterium]
MNELEQTEIWQVEVGGTVYDAPFNELPAWIAEGSLLPADKVRKGNLRWIEAQRVPKLVPFFNAKANGTIDTLLVNTTTVNQPPAVEQPAAPATFENTPTPAAQAAVNPFTLPAASAAVGQGGSVTHDPNVCRVHKDAPSFYVCMGCEGRFCKGCPSSYGGSVRICPECGQLCKPIAEAAAAAQNARFRSDAAAEGFSFGDLGNAFRHPFNFMFSLVVGGAIFAVLTIGQSASLMGGIAMAAASLICLVLANALTFAVLSHTVDAFAQGNLDSDFMPSFEDFSILESVLKPFFLSIGTYLVSFGPFLLTMAVALYMVMGAIGKQNDAIMSDLEKIPGTNYYAGRETAEQSAEVRKVIGNIGNEHAERIDEMNSAATGGESEVIDQDAKEQEELWAMAQQSRKVQLESVIGKTEETRQKEREQMVSEFLKLAAPLFVIGVLTFLWGLFFFPAAAAVAGYTQSFAATINPTVALDLIRRMGLDYVKLLLMGLILLIASGIISGIAGFIFSPFNIPGFGNIPSTAVSAFVGFYFFTVFSCVLGYAMFKSADRLKLPR